MPIRAIMLAYTFYGFIQIFKLLKTSENLKTAISKIISFSKEPYIFLLFLMLVSKLVSIIFSKNVMASVFISVFFATIVALGIITFVYFKNKPNETLNLIKTYAIIVFISCLFGYLQMFIYLKYHVLIGAIWNIPNNIPRIGSLFWDVNHFGALLASLLPVIGVLFLLSKDLKSRALYLAMFLPMSGILFLTNSRTAWLTAILSLFVFILVIFIRKFGLKGIFAVLLGMLLLAIPLVVQYQNRSSPFRALVRNYFHYRMDSFDSHILLIRGAFEIFGNYPILGSGVGSFYEHFSDTKVAAEFFGRDPAALNTRVPAHTIWGELASETGVIGLVLYLLFMGLNLLNLLYLSLKSETLEKRLLSTAMFSAVSGLLLAGIFYSYNSEFFWIIIFLYFMYAVGTLGKDYTSEKTLKYFVTQTTLPVAVLFLIIFALVFTNLGANHLIPWDEAIYANISKNMLNTGNYLVANWKVLVPWYEKPPLYMWLMAGFMKVFGVSSLAVKLPSAIMGFLTIISVYFFGKWVFKVNNEKTSNFSNKTVGFISALCLVTTVHFLYYSRLAMLDVTATFFITLSLFLYYVSKVSLARKKLVLGVFSGILCGLAIMTKGVIGFLPVPIIVLYETYLFITKQQILSKKLLKDYILFLICIVVISAPWHIYMTWFAGVEFWSKYLGYHVIDRAISSIEDKGRPFLWYIDVLRVSMRLWFVALMGALPFSVFIALRNISKKFNFNFVKNLLEGYEDTKQYDPHLTNAHVFLLIWSFFVFLLFSAASSKLVWYIIPIYPALSLLIGFFVERALNIFIHVFPMFKTTLFKAFTMFVLTSTVLTYLYMHRNMVYPSDLTGSQVELLKIKDKTFGIKSTIYTDRIELPLLMFYSQSPFEPMDFGPLRYKLTMATSYNEDVYFITKESRLRSYKEILPQIVLQAQVKEWALGLLPSAYSLDKSYLKDITSEITEIQKTQFLNPELRLRLNVLKSEEAKIQSKIETGLQSVKP